MSKTTNIAWVDYTDNIDASCMQVGQRINNQIKATEGAQQSLIQEINCGVYMLSIPQKNTSLLDIKKIADRTQYSLIPERHNNDIIIKISYNHLRNICYNDSVSSWAQRLGEQEGTVSSVYVLFFYHLEAYNRLWENNLAQNSFIIKERISNRLAIISNGTYNYPFDITRLVALSLWREISIQSAITMSINILQNKFMFFPALLKALIKIFNNYQWQLSNGHFRYFSNGLSKSFDYATLCDDIFFAHYDKDPENYIKYFNLEDLDCSSSFPTTSVRSLVHLKARPHALSSLQNGFALCASLENKGKQKSVQTSNDGGPLVFSHWLRRCARHLYRHHYQARVIFGPHLASNVFSVVGEQVASIALFPELIKGLLEQLSINYQGSVRLVAHNEDVLTIASKSANWNEINAVNEKATTLFKMIAPDGTDPLSLFEEIVLPPHGVGTFHLGVVPDEYFELIEAAFSMKHTMPPGHDNYLIGLSYECLQEWGMAVVEFQKALRQDCKDPTILSALGSALMEIGQPESALPFLKRAYDARPEDAELANSLGRLHSQCGNTQEAIKAFERAVRLSPGSADFLANLGGGYMEAARPLDALNMLNKAIRCDPTSASAHEMLAQLYLQNGDENLAKQHAMLAYQENPQDANIANLLWRLSMNKKDQHKG
jgi:Tfp pilus assembly protein PilF